MTSAPAAATAPTPAPAPASTPTLAPATIAGAAARTAGRGTGATPGLAPAAGSRARSRPQSRLGTAATAPASRARCSRGCHLSRTAVFECPSLLKALAFLKRLRQQSKTSVSLSHANDSRGAPTAKYLANSCCAVDTCSANFRCRRADGGDPLQRPWNIT